jgi:cellulose synthase/poly-beta-1,6-N-acetylglucosamine synthase-like glycosyltransferase
MQFTEVFYLITSFVGVYLSMVWLIVYFENRNKLLERPNYSRMPPVTFLVPAYNEEKHIADCIKSIQNIDYPRGRLKIIVINDGSTDRTAEIARKMGVRVITKKNEGSKAAAMNFGIKFVTTELVACMDADSFPTRDYLKKAVSHFNEKDIGAVASTVKVSNVTTIATKIQWVEYLMSVVFRKLFAILDCQFVVPGPGGIYRTAVLRKIGNFETNNLTEDMEMALRLQVHGYRLANCMDAHVYTACPEDFGTLFRQRMRWYRGYLENFAKYFYMFLNPKYGNFGMFFLPSTIIWIAVVVMLFIVQASSFVSDSIKGLFYWSLINFNLQMPTFGFDIFGIDSLFMALTIATVVGLTLSVIGIRTGGHDNVKGRKFFYVAYIMVYPILFAFFWFCAVMLHIFRVRGKWQ